MKELAGRKRPPLRGWLTGHLYGGYRWLESKWFDIDVFAFERTRLPPDVVLNQQSFGPNGPVVHPARDASALDTIRNKLALSAQRANRSTIHSLQADLFCLVPSKSQEHSRAVGPWIALIGATFPGPRRPWLGELLAPLGRNTKSLILAPLFGVTANRTFKAQLNFRLLELVSVVRLESPEFIQPRTWW